MHERCVSCRATSKFERDLFPPRNLARIVLRDICKLCTAYECIRAHLAMWLSSAMSTFTRGASDGCETGSPEPSGTGEGDGFGAGLGDAILNLSSSSCRSAPSSCVPRTALSRCDEPRRSGGGGPNGKGESGGRSSDLKRVLSSSESTRRLCWRGGLSVWIRGSRVAESIGGVASGTGVGESRNSSGREMVTVVPFPRVD